MSTLVVKFGGHAMTDEDGVFAAAINSAQALGHKVVVVHGGGPQINAALDAAHIQSTFVGGFRVTTPEIFAIVERVLTHEVGPAVAQSLTENGIPAQSISGRSRILSARKQQHLVDGTRADLGMVGTVQAADVSHIRAIIDAGRVPVVSPIAEEIGTGAGLNVNADIAAAAIAGALNADELIIMTDVAGIYRKWPDPSSLISEIRSTELDAMKNDFTDGMAPKVQSALDAIAAGAKSVRIIDGRSSTAFSDALIGRGGTKVIR